MLRVLFVSLSLLLTFSTFGQNQLSDRIFYGGGGGFSGGNDIIVISVAPQIGCRVTERYAAGVGITYQYVRFRDFGQTLSNYGWSVFNRYNITQQFFGYGEFERLSFQLPSDNSDRLGFNSLFFGLGFANQLSRNSSFNTMVLYNVLYVEGEPSPYRSPWVIRVGVGVGI
ncbi:MAG: hypothetical protein AAF616_12315 [Bacteroidota bacterium]